MAHSIRMISAIGLILSLLGLSACSSPVQTSTPTLDLNPVRTEVAATVLAQVTQVLLLTPSITLPPSPTVTFLPSSTPMQTPSPSPSAAPTSAPLSTAQGTARVTATAQVTQAPLLSATPTALTANLAEWVSQTIDDNTIFTPNETFTMTWRLKNVGTSTWTSGYMLRYYSGDAFSAPKEIPLGQQIQPGGMVDIVLHMKAPPTPGSYRSDWVMATDNRGNFKEPVYLKIIVALPPTRTPGP